jgi:hypothetical protein
MNTPAGNAVPIEVTNEMATQLCIELGWPSEASAGYLHRAWKALDRILSTPRTPLAETALRDALNEVIGAARDYLPPDGISKDDFINRVLGATDNPRINAAIAREVGR